MRLKMMLAVGGRPRYSAAIFVDALGAGLLRPFMVLYGLHVLGLGLTVTGAALTAGLVAGLVAIPLAGRWIDRSGGRPPVVFALGVRVAGVAVLLAAEGVVGFAAAAVLMSIGTQMWPGAHAALVAALVPGRERDVALGAGRALRNAGLGAGALLATVALAAGGEALRVLAGLSGAGYLIAAVLVWSLRVPELVVAERAPGAEVAGVPGKAFLVLCLLNLPFALMFDVLEVALPAVFLEQLKAGAGWPGAVFIANTVLVIALSVPLVLRFANWPRRWVLGLAGLVLAASYLGFLWTAGAGSAAGVALVSLAFTVGEILYAGSGVALVIATAPPGQLGRALARWELSTGIGKAAAPIVLTGLLGAAPAALWIPLAVVTAAAGLGIARWAPRDTAPQVPRLATSAA